MKIKITNGQDRDFIRLCHALDHYLNELVGGEENRSQYIPYNALDDIHDVLVAYDDTDPIGCASFKRYDHDSAEVKRVFVQSNYRGTGVGRQLLESLERLARDKGYSYLILESGEPLVEAMHLYRSLGYQVIPNYGPYVNMAESVCMRKQI